MCDYENTGKVGDEELNQYLEAVAELQNKNLTKDLDKIKSVVRTMMEQCNKKNDETFTKEEFIAWYIVSLKIILIEKLCFYFSLKKDHDVCVAFLPIAASKYYFIGVIFIHLFPFRL